MRGRALGVRRGARGARVLFPPYGFVGAGGGVVSGEVAVSVTEVPIGDAATPFPRGCVGIAGDEIVDSRPTSALVMLVGRGVPGNEYEAPAVGFRAGMVPVVELDTLRFELDAADEPWFADPAALTCSRSFSVQWQTTRAAFRA
jgi:hypothetical protein